MSSDLIIEGEVVCLPSDIIDEPHLLKEIISLSTWNELKDEQKSSLLEMLPQSLSLEEKHDTINCLFSGKDLAAFSSECLNGQSGNPIDDVVAKLENRYFSPESYQVKRCQRRAMRAKNKFKLAQYYHELLKEVIVSRQCHLAVASYPQLLSLSRQRISISESFDKESESKIQQSAETMYSRILDDVKKEVVSTSCCQEELVVSSDSDSPKSQDRFESKVVGSIVHTVTPLRLRNMLLQHKRRRDAKINTPDMNVSGIKLSDVINRTFGVSKKVSGLLKKRKRDESLKRAKHKKLKTQNVTENEHAAAAIRSNSNTLKVKKNAFTTSPSCYFELLRDVIQMTSDKTLSSIKLLVSDWLSSAEASRYTWTTVGTYWKELVQSALQFLSVKQEVVDKSPLGPFINNNNDMWAWDGQESGPEEDIMLQQLCKKWVDEVVKEISLPDRADDGNSFHAQERRRFAYSHQAFVYNIDGKRYPVPPVKGSTDITKEGRVAREHCLLKSERPPQVTLLALTRDAVARLPGGRGARGLVCTLLRDSQYLAPVVTDAQINAAVSGALDRLHHEPDPCVKYDASARSWFYVHAHRTPEELERIHAEQLGAPKKKREKVKKLKQRSSEVKKKTAATNEVKAVLDKPEQTDGNSKSENDVLKLDGSSNMASPLVINEAPNKPKQKQVKKKTKKTKHASQPGIGPQKINLKSSLVQPTGTRTIQLTQNQLLEMTKKLANPQNPRLPREVLITQVNPASSVKKEANPKTSRVVTLAKPLPSSQLHPHPSLKLILKPSTGDQQKPVAELVRVVDSNASVQRGQSGSARPQTLTTEALRRLSEQLSAASSRPIKIVQQNPTWSNKTPQAIQSAYPGSRVINISTQPEVKSNLISPMLSVNTTNTNRMTLSHVPPSGSVSQVNNLPLSGTNRTRTVYISANSKGDAVFNKQAIKSPTFDQSQVVHVVQKQSVDRKSASSINDILPAQKNRQQHIQVYQGKPQALQIVSGNGKIQTIHVVHKPANTSAPGNNLPSAMSMTSSHIVSSALQAPVISKSNQT